MERQNLDGFGQTLSNLDANHALAIATTNASTVEQLKPMELQTNYIKHKKGLKIPTLTQRIRRGGNKTQEQRQQRSRKTRDLNETKIC